jgi:hypothetical protein
MPLVKLDKKIKRPAIKKWIKTFLFKNKAR